MKYEPLKRRLEAQSAASQAEMSFREIESALGFALPASARKHQAWWSNTRHGHSHAAAWLDAGWRTTNLDLGRENVTFVKDPQGVAEDGAAFRHGPAKTETVTLNLADLSPAAQKLVDDHARDHGVDKARAVVAVLDKFAAERLRSILAWFAKASPTSTLNSVDLIREDRDAR